MNWVILLAVLNTTTGQTTTALTTAPTFDTLMHCQEYITEFNEIKPELYSPDNAHYKFYCTQLRTHRVQPI